ncbi:MAG: S-layer glycoprotein N-glycosyltransferase AglJ [Halococcoides sp.]
MPDRSDVCVLVPTYNESGAIEQVVTDFREAGYENVLVVDGSSTDGTRELAAEAGARVIEQSGSGKGQAVREAIETIDQPYILMVDGDATYRADDADAMVEPLFAGEADHVVGTRFADMEPGAMTRLNRAGNWLINRAFRVIHGRDLGDILSGYRAFTQSSIDRLNLSADGFGIETEMAVECVKQDLRTTVVPIRYESRPDGADTNLRPLRDGGIIGLTLYQMARTSNPLFYFGSLGLVTSTAGAGLGLYVAIDWWTQSISHEVLAVLSAMGIIFGVQLLMFAVLSDVIVSLHRERMQRFEEISARIDALGSEEADPITGRPSWPNGDTHQSDCDVTSDPNNDSTVE